MTAPNTDLRSREHSRCFVCQPDRPQGLGLQCALDDKGGAVARFACDDTFEGYDGLLHGGVVAALLDGVMTNCLFLHGLTAVTADLRVRYRKPVLLREQAVLHAKITETRLPLIRLTATLEQAGVVKAIAEATFFQRA